MFFFFLSAPFAFLRLLTQVCLHNTKLVKEIFLVFGLMSKNSAVFSCPLIGFWWSFLLFFIEHTVSILISTHSCDAVLAFSGFQCPSVCMWKRIGELGTSEWQMEAALWPFEIGKPFCPLLIECLTTGCSPHYKQPCFLLSKAALTWPTCSDSVVRSWQQLSSAAGTDAIEAWWMAVLWK